MNFDFSAIVPRELHPPLRWLGRVPAEWLEIYNITNNPHGASAFRFKRTIIETQQGWDAQQPILSRLLEKAQTSERGLCLLDIIAAALADGPKIFLPTQEQFDAMEQVEMNIPIAEYRQAYPAIVVRVPTGSLHNIATRYGLEPRYCPQFILTRNRLTSEGANCVSTFGHFSDDNSQQVYFFQDRPHFATVEQALQRHTDFLNGNMTPESLDYRQAMFNMDCVRSVLNLMLMLTHFGWRSGGPLNKKRHEKIKRNPKLQKFAISAFSTIEMAQNIIIRKEERGPGHDQEPIPTGRDMPPHWRKGHWRMQHYGPGNMQTKRIFIRPTLVRRDRAQGDLGDSIAVYRG